MTVRGRERIADWIEIALLVRGSRPLGIDPLHTFFEKSRGLEPQRVNTGLREMDRRSRVLGERYPFVIHGEYAVQCRQAAESSTYAAMLLLAPGNPVREYINPAPDESMAVIFEDAVVAATSALWGESGKALRFGWPSDIGRPPEFDLAIQWLAAKIGVKVGHGYRQPRRKDGGVDVVAWRPFPDRRTSFPILLVQCTLQENLVAKGMDVDTRLWSSWLSMDTDPATALATPTVLSSGPTWDELALKHMVLDRLRIVGLAEEKIRDEATTLWVGQTLSILEDHMGEIGEL